MGKRLLSRAHSRPVFDATDRPRDQDSREMSGDSSLAEFFLAKFRAVDSSPFDQLDEVLFTLCGASDVSTRRRAPF